MHGAVLHPGVALRRVSRESHDTISMVAIDARGNIAAGSSTNGASHKVLSTHVSQALRLPHQHQWRLCLEHASACPVLLALLPWSMSWQATLLQPLALSGGLVCHAAALPSPGMLCRYPGA